jgi:hypothetical protein
MLRTFVLLALTIGIAWLAAPFVMSSLYIDDRGITLPGRVHSKSERVKRRYSDWTRVAAITVEYGDPETGGVSFFDVPLDPERFDGFHTGQPVPLHYLRARDTPELPLAQAFRGMHLLPTVRLADQRAFSGLTDALAAKVPLRFQALAAVVILLLLWRVARWPGFVWAFGMVFFSVALSLFLLDFPRPTRRPAVHVRQASGTVKSIDQIDRLFSGAHTKGWDADQPVAVVGVEFVPAGRTEKVLAVDLIDAGSIPGLQEKSVVGIDYEAGHPRTAYIQKASRRFVSRNVAGIVKQGVACLVVLIVFYAVVYFFHRAFHRLTVPSQP